MNTNQIVNELKQIMNLLKERYEYFYCLLEKNIENKCLLDQTSKYYLAFKKLERVINLLTK